ncbi:MAG: M18 family aminopeptidase, partial [Rhodobacterales bacterium]|nr:M18 family aminopeptidase [Rhodobacterales bacterium]
HPAYADKHDATHMPKLNAGPVIKSHANQNYTTEGDTAALFKLLCAKVDAPVQLFVSRSDLRCGSTVGPMLASSLGCRSVDVGNPMLSMHSVREMCGTADHKHMVAAVGAFFSA